MTKKKLSFKKWLSMLLTAVMLVAALPISAFAAPASGIPANMLDNVYLDALAYTGYNVQAQKDDGTIFIKTGSSVSASIRSGIGYGTGPSGLETNSGGAPDIARFRSHGLCCASYVSYVYYNYMTNVAHINTATVPCPSNPRSATAYNTAANGWVESGKARRISFTQSSDGSNFNPSEEIPIGSLIVFKHIPTGSIAHVAIYAGYYNGKHFVTHVGNDRGPEFSTIVGMSKGDYPEAVVQVVVPEFVEAYGSIEVQKNDTNGKGLAGAYFVATSQKDGTQYLIGPTDAGGHGSSIERIPYGQYTVKETVFPANYRAYGQTEWTVTVSAANNGVARFTAVNEEIPGNVKIVKESEDGKISGIRLNISGNGVNEDVVTGSDGSITVKDLKPGTYTVSEYEYEGYVPLPPQTVTVVSGGTSILKDRIILFLSLAVFAASVVRVLSYYRIITDKSYETVEGVCVSIVPKPLRKYRKIKIMDGDGNESTMLLGKQSRVKIGYRYRFYFKETQRISLGSEYLNSAMSSDHFLGYEELGEFAAETTE